MTGCFDLSSRRCVVAWSLAVMLLLGGCQTSKIPTWMQDQSAGPQATAPPSQATISPPRTTQKAASGAFAPESIQFPFQPSPDSATKSPQTKTATTFVTPVWPTAAEAGPATPQPVAPNSVATATERGPFPEDGQQWPSFTPYLTRPQEPGAPAPAAAPRPTVPVAAEDSVRVALLLPLSGPNGGLGQAMLNAAQLAMFNFADQRFELLVHDTKGTPQGASSAASAAIGDGASIILGPLLAASVRAVGPQAQAANVPVIAFSSDRSVAGNGTYTMGFLPSAEIRRIVAYARSKGVTRFAALAPDNVYGETVINAFEAAVARNGGSVARVQFYDPRATDFTAAVRVLADYDTRRQVLLDQRKELEGHEDEVSQRALKRLERLQTIGDLPFDALLLADGGKRLLSIAALLPFYDIDPGKIRMLGTGQWDVPGLGSEPALVGGWFAAPSPMARADFVNNYRETYGAVPPRLVTLAYDATALAAVQARSKSGPDFSASSITVPSGFWGRDGIFRFLSNGISERGLAVMRVGRRDSEILSRAPETFQAQVN
ncbi:MAG: ABC transporter substrate-binding protein [Alphaproteobacteria bacterium]|nr:ABC transporter substrate-binding protein [Alphaproteobacteria bacterium]